MAIAAIPTPKNHQALRGFTNRSSIRNKAPAIIVVIDSQPETLIERFREVRMQTASDRLQPRIFNRYSNGSRHGL